MGTSNEDAIYKDIWYRNGTEFESEEVTSIPPGGFYGFADLERVDFPNCTEIGKYAFADIKKDFKYNFPNVISFGGAISDMGNTLLTTIDFPALASACQGAFRTWPATKVNLPNLIIAYQESLKELRYFSGDLILPALTTISGPQVFGVNGNLNGGNEIRYIFPKLKTFEGSYNIGSLFGGSSYLTLIDLGFLTTNIQTNFVQNDYMLQTLILRNLDAIVPLAATSGFENTPFVGYNELSGTVYVPEALVESYQTAENWATLYEGGYCTFLPLEGSPYEASNWYEQ